MGELGKWWKESLVGKEAFFFALEWPLNMDLTGKLKTQTLSREYCGDFAGRSRAMSYFT